jgi:hypothetical protein
MLERVSIIGDAENRGTDEKYTNGYVHYIAARPFLAGYVSCPWVACPYNVPVYPGALCPASLVCISSELTSRITQREQPANRGLGVLPGLLYQWQLELK